MSVRSVTATPSQCPISVSPPRNPSGPPPLSPPPTTVPTSPPMAVMIVSHPDGVLPDAVVRVVIDPGGAPVAASTSDAAMPHPVDHAPGSPEEGICPDAAAIVSPGADGPLANPVSNPPCA